MAVQNHYKALGVEENATENEIKKAYRQIALKDHPDKNGGDLEATERFKKAAEAYSVIGNDEERRKYDRDVYSRIKEQAMAEEQRKKQTSTPTPLPTEPAPLRKKNDEDSFLPTNFQKQGNQNKIDDLSHNDNFAERYRNNNSALASERTEDKIDIIRNKDNPDVYDIIEKGRESPSISVNRSSGSVATYLTGKETEEDIKKIAVNMMDAGEANGSDPKKNGVDISEIKNPHLEQALFDVATERGYNVLRKENKEEKTAGEVAPASLENKSSQKAIEDAPKEETSQEVVPSSHSFR